MIGTAPPPDASGARSHGALRRFLAGDFARGFLLRVAAQTGAIIVLIEAIFLAEHFTWVFRDAVRHEADLFGISLVLLFTSTEIFDLALAIAILLASYAALLRLRENREMLVLFGSGLGPVPLGALVLVVALAGVFVSALGNGVIDPASRYGQRVILFSSELRSLKKGVAKGEFYYFPSYVAYAMDHPKGAAPPQADTQVIDARPNARASLPSRPGDRTLFVYQQIAPHTSRVVTAASARLDGPDRAGRVVLNLSDFTAHTFEDAHPLVKADGAAAPMPCADCLKELKEMPGGTMPRVTMHVRDMSQLMMVDQLLPFAARANNLAEQTIFEQLFVPDTQGALARAAQMKLLGERLSRSLLAFLAPLVALLGVALTTRLTSWLALPLSCLALMSVNLGCEALLNWIAPASVTAAVLPVLLLYAGVAAALLVLSAWRHESFARPQLGRS